MLDLPACIDAVEHSLAQHALNPGDHATGVLALHAGAGGFHIKAARVGASFVAKSNGNFPGNPERNGLPTIQGLLLLADATTGRPLAVMDSASLTRIRTAAATGVAVRHLASSDADSAAIIGCGVQALDQLRAVHVVRPLRRATAFDVRPGVALQFAERASEALSIPVRAVHALVEATREIPIIVTCTTARAAFLGTDHVSAGALVAAVGADHPEKHEIQPGLMAIAAIITDVTAQCAAFGDLRHAIAAGVVTSSAVRAELGEVVAGVRAGRVDAAERIVFDSTGTALQDVAAAALVFERARAAGAGMAFDFEG